MRLRRLKTECWSGMAGFAQTSVRDDIPMNEHFLSVRQMELVGFPLSYLRIEGFHSMWNGQFLLTSPAWESCNSGMVVFFRPRLNPC